MGLAEGKILLVEDEEGLGSTLSEYLSEKCLEVHWTKSVSETKALLAQGFLPDVALLDVGLPDGVGLDLVDPIKKQSPQVVLIFLTALNSPDDRVRGLETGANDYITKPFALRELLLRLERIFQQTGYPSQAMKLGQLKVFTDRYEIVDQNGKAFPLGQKECLILKMLLQKNGDVLTRDEIISEIWGEDAYPSHRTVDNYIVRLRRLVDIDSSEAVKISTVRGVGYKLEITS